MKTRIKVIEYNSGNKEFICQIDNANWIRWWLAFLSVIGTAFAIGYLITGHNWKTMEKETGSNATFSNIEGAKAFINKKLQEETDELFDKYKYQVKKITKIKYPI
jgi:uncharacterized membrane protein YjgN (DUF898 family)